MLLLVDVRLKCRWWRGRTQLAFAELTHHSVHSGYLHSDVEQYGSLRHPVVGVSGTQGRNPGWRSSRQRLGTVRLPDHLTRVQGIELRCEGWVAVPDLFASISYLSGMKIINENERTKAFF